MKTKTDLKNDLTEELQELNTKIEKLEKFTDECKYDGAKHKMALLLAQLNTMKAYEEILKIRIFDIGI